MLLQTQEQAIGLMLAVGATNVSFTVFLMKKFYVCIRMGIPIIKHCIKGGILPDICSDPLPRRL